ncbi:MAG: PHP domain-containing protein [Clostridia bacterium]|nr:PHP domain-containing protein [Clostridia bacterium]
MMSLCDLHAHTTASDGSYTPEELVRYAKEKGLGAVAVTDHDTIDGLERAVREGQRIGQRVIPGIEITTGLEGCEIHMVGLFLRFQELAFQDRVAKLAKTRDVRNERMVQKLIDLGFRISFDDLKRFEGSVLTKAHIGQLLVERGYAPDVPAAMNTSLRRGGVAYIERETPTPKEAASLIHEAGGLAFVAHTNQIDKADRDHSCAICRQALQMGADGLETRYCEFDDDWRSRTEAIAREFSCLRSGGSDFHGAYKQSLDLMTGYGDLEVPYAFVEAMEARLSANV